VTGGSVSVLPHISFTKLRMGFRRDCSTLLTVVGILFWFVFIQSRIFYMKLEIELSMFPKTEKIAVFWDVAP
jgi:hypothetical protein